MTTDTTTTAPELTATDVALKDLAVHELNARAGATAIHDAEGVAEPASWRLTDALRAAGAQGVLVPSCAAGAGPGDLNLVLWSWNAPDGAEVTVIDDHGRLPTPSGADGPP